MIANANSLITRALLAGIAVLACLAVCAPGKALAQPDSTVQTDQVPATLTTITGSKYSGKITQTGVDYLVITDANDEKIAYDQITSLVYDRPVTSPPEESINLQLICGSTLECTRFVATDGTSEIFTASGLLLNIETRNIEFVRLRSFNGLQQLEDQWTQIVSTPLGEGDAIVVSRDGSLDSLEGLIGDVTTEKIAFQMEERSANISRSKIDGLRFYHAAGRELPGALCEVRLTDNSRIVVRTIDLIENGMQLTTVSGCVLELPDSCVARIDFAVGRTVYLSDVEPASRDWQPLMASENLIEQLRTLNRPRTNESFRSEPLALEFRPEPGVAYIKELKEFEHGFAMKAGSKIVFTLDGKYERLTGLVGFDPNANAGGNVGFRVRCDKQTMLDENLIKSQLENPLELDIQVKGVDRLVIEIDYFDGLEIGDTLHVCELKVAK